MSMYLIKDTQTVKGKQDLNKNDNIHKNEVLDIR